ncbi:MAG: type 1 glutamine amidotransferase [Rhizobiaceae bacterium]|nr:type 1 glutamine amidotransferase [Rhizobiaceae bacterium]MCV0405077.1 type 1 glutamine amidotransferase [Rhizobiaceae bacterium]
MPAIDTSRIMILATNGFEQSELEVPLKKLGEHGAAVHVVSLSKDPIRGWKKTDWGDAVEVDRLIDDVTVADYDAVVLPGGQINPDLLRVEEKVVSFIRAFARSGKPLAAICHAPWLLVEAGLLEGKKATSYHSIRTDVVNAGASWEDSETVVDGNLITARKPDDLDAFVRAVVDMVENGAETRAAA